MQHPSLCLQHCVPPAPQIEHHVPAQPSPAGALQTDACVGFSTQSLAPGTPVGAGQPTQLPRTGTLSEGEAVPHSGGCHWRVAPALGTPQLSAMGAGAW